MNWADTIYPTMAIIIALITLMHAFTDHRRAWLSRISGGAFMTALLIVGIGGTDTVGTSGPLFWVVATCFIVFVLLTAVSLLVVLYDAVL